MSILSKNKRERSIRQQQELCNHFAESLNKAIWPSTNVDKFIKLLQETNYKCLNVRHGSRQDTCLHRFEIYIRYWFFIRMYYCTICTIHFNWIYICWNWFQLLGPADLERKKLCIFCWRKGLWWMRKMLLGRHHCILLVNMEILI